MRALLAAALLLALTGCSVPDAEPETGPTPSTSAPAAETPQDPSTAPETPQDSRTATPYLPVPDGVELTAQGVDLDVGDRATVAWEPRLKVVGALSIRVDRLEKASLKALAAFRLDKIQRNSAPYYVRATVTNVGDTDLSGVSVPLYLVDGRDTLIQATPFAATFKPCPSRALPKPFATGDKLRVCLVYLVPDHGRMESVSFRPTQEYDPITWTGPLEKPRAVPGEKKD